MQTFYRNPFALSREAVCIQMLGNTLITLTAKISNNFQVCHTTWMEFAFSYQLRLDNKENVKGMMISVMEICRESMAVGYSISYTEKVPCLRKQSIHFVQVNGQNLPERIQINNY
jgi:hypothetical protein